MTEQVVNTVWALWTEGHPGGTGQKDVRFHHAARMAFESYFKTYELFLNFSI